MKTYPHAPSEEVFRENLSDSANELFRRAAATPETIRSKNEWFFPLNANTALECGCLAYALDEGDAAVVADYFMESSWSFEQAIVRRAPINLEQMIQQYAIALALGLHAAAAAIAALPRAHYSSPNLVFPESAQKLFDAEKALVVGDAATFERDLSAARANLSDLPKAGRADFETVLEVETAIGRSDPLALDAALKARVKALTEKLRNPRIRNVAKLAIDFWGLGLLKIAGDHGLKPTVKSVYWPTELLRP
jgi:hypothetical protein